MANGLFPAFVRLFYHTAFGLHVQTIPTKEWGAGISGGPSGGYLNWDGDPVDAEDMIDALVAELLDFQPASCIYDSAIIYTLSNPEALPQPQVAYTIGEPGVSASADVPASQATMTLRTTGFNLFKLVWFDAAPTTDFLPQRSLPGSGQPLDLFNVVTSPLWAWSGRDGFRPNQFIQVSYTLNETLRRQYRLN